MNAWNLTRRQSEVLSMLCDTGCRKVAAYRLGVSEQAVCRVLQAAFRRMHVRTDISAALAFDRRYGRRA